MLFMRSIMVWEARLMNDVFSTNGISEEKKNRNKKKNKKYKNVERNYTNKKVLNINLIY